MLIPVLLVIGGSVLATFLVRALARRVGAVDRPDGLRKYHMVPVPLFGGLALYSVWITAVVWAVYAAPRFGTELLRPQIPWIIAGSTVLLILGLIDDVRPLSAKTRLVVTAFIILLVAAKGIHITKITNPFGGVINLSGSQVSLGALGPLAVVPTLLAFVWLMGLTYTTKLLDGLDGLATGVAAIGGFMLAGLSLATKFYQPNVAFLALLFAGACVGFLVFNFPKASIFLGESGSLLVGFWLSVLAVISGGKLATAFLVMAIPILDVLRVMYVRLRRGQPLMQGDREHLHFRLLDRGWSPRRILFFYYSFAAVFGLLALYVQSIYKLAIMALLVASVLFMAARASLLSPKKV